MREKCKLEAPGLHSSTKETNDLRKTVTSNFCKSFKAG
jgi:hypothetical protein